MLPVMTTATNTAPIVTGQLRLSKSKSKNENAFQLDGGGVGVSGRTIFVRGSLSRWVSVQMGLCPDGLCLGRSFCRGSLSKGVSVRETPPHCEQND